MLNASDVPLMSRTHWATPDYADLSWHDNHVHGLSIREGLHGTGELVLDLDFILEWLPAAERFSFRLAPATLVFHDLTDLTVSLEYGRLGAAIGPFSIGEVSREVHVFTTGHSTYRWHIQVNWPEGALSFLASGFTQDLRAAPRHSSSQCLPPEDRASISGA